MPRLFVVSDQVDATGLVRSLLGARVAAAKRDAAIADLRRANPDLDLDQLQPGHLVVLPDDLADAKNAGDDPVRTAMAEALSQATESVKELASQIDTAEAARRAEAEEARALISSQEVVRLAKKEPQLKQNLAAVEKELAAQDARAEDTREALARASQEWLTDLQVLRNLADS